MKPVVIDASAAAPWIIPEERTPVSDQLFADVMESSGVFHAPALWIWETANILLVSVRRRRLAAELLDAGLELLGACPIEFDSVPDPHRRAQVMRLANTHGLTIYDAAYLELALRLNSQLASADRQLVAAAKSCGIPCLDL
ncbi:type II toxin-antitoxin system VapC family toxin [Ramlibacter sp.]|uniref:type II toxin-antitoxin system VapC family toxin n=1 Tax=Ramlibacter sp. TaxID=1917967 RepID=UPI00184D8BC8|nr:type II toxin-antitoxin system VapC family toxin [Ramlibacter sp.]MBA2674928.1 type II toxin-antitoxin system VapC family toxin [Ramlibacter sp.]